MPRQTQQELDENDEMVRLDPDQCCEISIRLAELKLGPFKLPARKYLLPFKNNERNINYLFLMCTLLFDLKGLGGRVKNEWLHGSEYLFASMKEETKHYPDLFAPENLTTMAIRNLDTLLSHIGTSRNNFNQRALERAQILKSVASRLHRQYQGKASNLLSETEGFLVRDDHNGLIELMQQFKGYSDPHFKKGFVFLKFITRLGFFEPLDKDNLYVPMDYHVMRVALRTGIIRIIDEMLRTKLINKNPATPEEDFQIRNAAKKALKVVERSSKFDAFDLDDIFWNIGRSHCHYSHEPMCNTCPGIKCTYESLLNYKCQGECLLNRVCRGSQIEDYKKILEPVFTTTYY